MKKARFKLIIAARNAEKNREPIVEIRMAGQTIVLKGQSIQDLINALKKDFPDYIKSGEQGIVFSGQDTTNKGRVPIIRLNNELIDLYPELTKQLIKELSFEEEETVAKTIRIEAIKVPYCCDGDIFEKGKKPSKCGGHNFQAKKGQFVCLDCGAINKKDFCPEGIRVHSHIQRWVAQGVNSS